MGRRRFQRGLTVLRGEGITHSGWHFFEDRQDRDHKTDVGHGLAA